MKDTRTLTEGAILASIFTIILLITIYVPLISMITLWALPLPFVVYVVRKGLKPGLFLIVVTCFLAFFIGNVQTIPAALIFGSAGVVTGELYRRKLSGFSILIGAGLTYTLNMLLVYLGLVLVIGENPMKIAIELTREQMELAESTLTSIGQVPGGSIEQMNQMMDLLMYLAPLMLVGVGVTLAFITVVLSSLLLRRLGHTVNQLPPFREWRFPKAFLWYYLIVLLIGMMGIEKGTTMFVVISNLFPLLEIILMIQGFAFVFYYCHTKKVAGAIPVILVITSIVFAPLLHVVRILGIIDLGFDLRKRITSKKK